MLISHRTCMFAAISIVLFAGFAAAQTLPDYYDLRNVDGTCYVTKVKAQAGGTCWTHGAMAAIEGNLLMTGAWLNNREDGEPNLAEYHLDWWCGFNVFNNDDIDPPTGTGLTVHYGGDYMVTSAYLTRGEGAVRDIDGQKYKSPPSRYDPYFHYYYAPTIEWYEVGSDLSNIDTVKQAVIDHGVVGTCMCYKNSFINSQFIHYQPPSNSSLPNHAIAIVGWDDNKDTQASKDGAWLCKNSWGVSWGYEGYFWISYYDKWCGKEPEMGAISYQDVQRNPYDKFYYHDYHGCRDVMTGITEAFNAFTAELTEPGERLQAVSFFNATQDVSYTVRIYDDFNGYDLLNELSSKSGFIAQKGYHTIELDTKPFLTEGDDFYIYVMLDKGGHAYDRTSEVPVLLGSSQRVTVPSSGDYGESFYREGGVWKDIHDFNETANFCLKGLTIIEPAVHLSFPEPLPLDNRPTGVSVPMQVEITPGLANYVPGTGMLHYRFHPDDSFSTVPFTPLGGDLYTVEFPNTFSGAQPEYYFSAEGDNGKTAYMPKNVPYDYYGFDCFLTEFLFLDEFETSSDWGVEDYPGTYGGWEWGDPEGTDAQPEDDYTPSGTNCWVTGKSGGAAEDNDLDGGPSVLKTSSIDLSFADDALVSFYLWFYHSTSGVQYPLSVRLANNGISFLAIDRIHHNPHWVKHTYKISDYVDLTNKVQFQFWVFDEYNDSIVEALIDDFQVELLHSDPTFWADRYEISVSEATEITFSLGAGPDRAGRDYLVVGTLSGNMPGTALPGGEVIRINRDWFTDLLLSCLGSPFCQDFYGTLDGAGQGTAVLNTLGPIDPVVIGEQAMFAYLLASPPAYDFTSNAIAVTFDP